MIDYNTYKIKVYNIIKTVKKIQEKSEIPMILKIHATRFGINFIAMGGNKNYLYFLKNFQFYILFYK